MHGGAFRYRATEEGTTIVLYSTGADKRDDGGVEDPADPTRALERATGRGLDYILFERIGPESAPP